MRNRKARNQTVTTSYFERRTIVHEVIEENGNRSKRQKTLVMIEEQAGDLESSSNIGSALQIVNAANQILDNFDQCLNDIPKMLGQIIDPESDN